MHVRQHVVRFALLARLMAGALVLSAVCLASVPAFAQQAPKFGYVDFQRALNEVEEGKQVKAKLERDFKAKQAQLDKKQKEVMDLKTTLEQQAQMLSEDARRKRFAEFQTEMANLQQLYMQLQTELAQAEAEATQKIFERMRTITEEIGKAQNYTMIFERNEAGLLYAPAGADLTNELIKRYNAKK